MNDEQYVFHGTNLYKERANPIKHRRTKKDKNGVNHVIFNDISFHATPLKWIALAYTYTPQSFQFKEKKMYYNVGIDLYNNKQEVEIYGFESLEKSLIALYKNGGYLLQFDQKDFYHQNGLGNFELITQKEIEPISIEKIENPIKELEKMGVTFTFIDLSQS